MSDQAEAQREAATSESATDTAVPGAETEAPRSSDATTAEGGSSDTGIDTGSSDTEEYVYRQVTSDDLGGMSFEEAIAGTIVEFDDGDIVTGTIVKVDKDEVLLDIGYKSEGVIPARELSIRHDVDPSEIVKIGEEVEALVLQKEDKEGRLILSKKRAQYERAWGTIERIKEQNGVVSGPVIEVVKGGLILDIGLRGFLPASLVELRRVRDLQPYVGRVLEAKIIELDKHRNNVVLSRRAWLEETQKEQREEFLDNLKPGERRKGTVSSVVNFGAFVDLGGMDGLVHVSELSWKHVDHPSSVVQVGDEVEVEVLEVDLDRERISLSLKATQQDPWQEFANNHRVGELVYGRVTKLVPFGAVRAGGRRDRGPGPHLGDGGPPRRAARAGRHPGRGAVGQDHRSRPPAPPHQPVDQAGRRGRCRRSPSTRRPSATTPTTSRATTSGEYQAADFTPESEGQAAWAAEYAAAQAAEAAEAAAAEAAGGGGDVDGGGGDVEVAAVTSRRRRRRPLSRKRPLSSKRPPQRPFPRKATPGRSSLRADDIERMPEPGGLASVLTRPC